MKRKRTLTDYALWAALPMAQTSKIERRLRLILSGGQSRRAMTRWLWGAGAALALGAALVVATAGTPPRSLMAALTSGAETPDTPAHIRANIAYYQAQIARFGDGDPWAGKAYYVLGNAQTEIGQTDAALASYDRAIALPEPPYDSPTFHSNIQSSARYERINALSSAGRNREAAAETETLLKGDHLVTGDLWINLRERLPEMKQLGTIQADRAAEARLYRGLTASPRWTQTLTNGVTVQLVGILQVSGNVYTAWSPEGKWIGRARYKSQAEHGGYGGAEPIQKVLVALRFTYPAGQAITTEYTVSGASSTSFQNGFARDGGKVVTDEDAMNRETAGRRIVEAWFPVGQVRADLRVGVTAGPPPAGQTDSIVAPQEWTVFSGITLPPARQRNSANAAGGPGRRGR